MFLVVSKILKFSLDPKVCHEARYPDDIMELQEDINQLKDWANKRQMKFNVGKCSVMHIVHNNINDTYLISNQQLPVTDQHRDLRFIFTKDLKWQHQTEKGCKTTYRVVVVKQRKAAKPPTE